jgi:hypothetical protein
MKPFLRFYPTLCALSILMSGCSHQPNVDHADDLKQLQVMAGEHDAQGKRVEQRQDEILAQVQALQTQLAEQKTLLEARPQVVEKITRIACPPAVVQSSPVVKPKEQPNTDKLVIGLRENILLTGVNLVMSAKISPQLSHSILDARNIQMFERNSEEWVRFTLYNPENNEPHVLERKLQGFQNIQGANKTTERRPLVEIRFALGKLKQKGQFVLADRSNSDFRMLVGRNLLRDVMLVDVSGENLIPVIREEKKETEKTETQNKKE